MRESAPVAGANHLLFLVKCKVADLFGEECTAGGIHGFSIQVGVFSATVTSSTRSLGRKISLGFLCREPGLIAQGIGMFREICLGLLDQTTGLDAFVEPDTVRAGMSEMQLIVPPGQGHNMWAGFFQCQELVDFVLTRAIPPAQRQ